jgi:flavin reductase (DIM6/NTAB) family NADH-FMN oxidoreductase RutF
MNDAVADELTSQAFRRVAGLFATGVSVMTSRLGDHLHGMTANTFCTVSLHPLMMLLCVEKKAHMHDLLEQSGVFALTFLGEEQEGLSRRFADRQRTFGAVEFEGIPHRLAANGCPLLEGGLGHLEGRVEAMYPGGDHSIVVAAVTAMGIDRPGNPLIFFSAHYRRLTPSLSAPETRR